MLRGIRRQWQQPVYYGFCNGGASWVDIMHVIKEIVNKCEDIGLKILCCVCDQGSNNVRAINDFIFKTRAEKLRAGIDMDISEHFFEINGQKIFPIFDGPHLLKCIRNNLIEKDLIFVKEGTKMKGSWSHLEKAYKMDPFFGSLRLMPKLSENHVHPNHKQKMKVSLCSQVFSFSVARAINTLAITQHQVEIEGEIINLGAEAAHTAKLFEFLNNFFDSINSSGNSSGCVLKNSVTKFSSHWKFWEEAKHVFRSMQFEVLRQQHKKRPICLKNSITTITNIQNLCKFLIGKNFKFINLRSFNQDPLENFFGCIRQKGKFCTNPTPALFTKFYKSLLIGNIITPKSKLFNCEDDFTKRLGSIKILKREVSVTIFIRNFHFSI